MVQLLGWLWSWDLYYKTLRIRNLWQICRFHKKLMSFLLPVTKHTILDKHTSLLQIP
jgi:hypothetical protein